ncbi:MAG: AAA family ATPase, partial [Lentisphaeria bacterium]|nr:AAA family ATPase [Lentisphaeria bacterium]
KITIGYPDQKTELKILKLVHQEELKETTTIKVEETVKLIHTVREAVHQIHTAPEIEQYIVDLVMQTRQPKADSDLSKWLKIGASPRATIALHKAARALAVIEGKTFVSPDEVRKVAPWVLGHRIHLSYEAFAEQITPTVVVNEIIKQTLIP